MIKVDLFINDINNSNCYVVHDQNMGSCIIVDPGSRNIKNILESLKKKKLRIDYIMLTHSHFDHIAGVNNLVGIMPAKIISSKLCSEKIVDPLKNLSYFADFGIISAPKADLFIEDLENGRMEWNDNKIFCFHSPGHTRCSICIHVDNMLFTGDTILKGLKTKITYPDGNREELRTTLRYIYDNIPGDISVFPGHGESFILESQDISISLKTL